MDLEASKLINIKKSYKSVERFSYEREIKFLSFLFRLYLE